MATFSPHGSAYLLRKKNMEIIPLNKPRFHIGRERNYVDYCIADNSSISRNHAQILCTDGSYTISDCNSVNHTYVNGELLPPGREIPLRAGDVIRLGSEVFEFFLDSAPAGSVASVCGDTSLGLYRILYEGLDQMQPRIQCPVSCADTINETLHKILLEHPELCHFEGDWQWESAVVPVYTLSSYHRNLLHQQLGEVMRSLWLPPQASPLEKAAAIYRWLAVNVSYDPAGLHTQSAYGALVERRAVCKGIAKAYQLLLTEAGIPSQLVEGTLDGNTKHVWNAFRVDGLLYHSDVTMAYPRFMHIAARGALNFTAVSQQQIQLTHTIWDSEQKAEAVSKTFFQSLQNTSKSPRHPLNQIPQSLRRYLPEKPQFLAAGSVSDVYRCGSSVLKRISCGDDPARLYHAVREHATLHKLSTCFQVAHLLAWDITLEPEGYVLYLVLEYGQPMEEYCGRKPLTPAEAVGLIRSTCDALQQCYAAGIAHLDVQPGNLLVMPGGIVKLTDFSSAVPVMEVAQLSDLRGTPAYMAPEVYHSRTYSQAADVYSLGILLYCLLSGGKLPHGNIYPPHEATKKRMEGLPVLLEGTVDPGLRALVEKACSFDPARRFPHLQSFSVELDRLQHALQGFESEPVTASAMRLPGAPVSPITAPYAPPRPAAAPYVPPAPAAAPAKQAAQASRGLFSAFRKNTPKSQPAPPPAPAPAPRSIPTPPPAPAFSADTFGASTVLASPVYRGVPTPPPAPAPSVFTADQVGMTVMPAPPTCPPAPPAQARVDKVQFSAVAPQKAVKGEYALVQLFMYEQEFRSAVDEALQMAEAPMQEKKTGFYQVRDNTQVKVVLTSPDVEILDDTAEETWNGGYLCFDFALDIPQEIVKKQILLKAAVYFDGIPATRLMMTMRLQTQHEQRMEVLRSDVLSAFVSYASQDRARVGGLIQGMKKARPDMDIFFDVNSLRSGDDWEATLRQEVERRDILFLCWSKHASVSPWVDMEWRYALQNKGIECIEPIPIDPPDECPPPQELQSKHFNDSLLYIINRP